MTTLAVQTPGKSADPVKKLKFIAAIKGWPESIYNSMTID